MEDSAPVAAVTVSGVAGCVGEGVARVLLDVESLEGYADGDVGDGERSGVLCAEHPAYVIYTSGSTGRPKAVVVPHRAVVDVVVPLIDDFRFGPGERMLQFASVSFDAAVWEFVIPLCSGGTMVVAPAERLMPGPALAELVAETGVTLLILPRRLCRSCPMGRSRPASLWSWPGTRPPRTRWSAGPQTGR